MTGIKLNRLLDQTVKNAKRNFPVDKIADCTPDMGGNNEQAVEDSHHRKSGNLKQLYTGINGDAMLIITWHDKKYQSL